MRKKISSKVVRSVPLNDGIISESSHDINFSNNNHLEASEWSAGCFSYKRKLHKIQVSYDDPVTAKILDSYV